MDERMRQLGGRLDVSSDEQVADGLFQIPLFQNYIFPHDQPVGRHFL
jgi:hypothetical protein